MSALVGIRHAVHATLAVATCVCAVLLAVASPVSAVVAPGPGLSVHVFAMPSSFSAADNPGCLESLNRVEVRNVLCDAYKVTVRNVGSRPTAEGSPVVLADTVPAGVTVREVRFFWSEFEELNHEELNLAGLGFCDQASLRCELPGEFPLQPGQTLRMYVFVTVDPGTLGSLTDRAVASGGGALEASASVQNEVGSPAVFGASLTPWIVGLDGSLDTQAGAHPTAFLARIDLNNVFTHISDGQNVIEAVSPEDLRDIVVDLPVGFLGSALATPQCTFAQLASHVSNGVGGCPTDTILGHIFSQPAAVAMVDGPLYNMVPERGMAAEFGYVDTVAGTHALAASVVPTPEGYVLRTTSPEIPQIGLNSVEVSLFGDPAEEDKSGNVPVALFTNPASCSGTPLMTRIHTDSWSSPGRRNADGTPDFTDPSWVSEVGESPPVTGCNLLQFDPSLGVHPETTQADSPTGVGVELKVPQSEVPGTLATPPLRNASVTLPAGLTVNPAAAGGLGACTEAQIGWLGGSLSNFTASAPACPEDSKIGTVEVETPLLGGTLQGSIYLAAQDENPFHTLLAGYIVIDDPATGVVVKIPGNLTPDPSTGQITGVFDENPQFPVSDLRLHFFGGPRAPLATPQGCGTYTTTSDLMPWSAPDSGPDATPVSSFQIDSGCQAGFAPGFAAENLNPQAGGYSPFALSISRNDGEQDLAGVSVTLPKGSLGKIAGIPLCSDAQANAGVCPAGSQLGTVTAGAGVGPNPFFVSGKAYLTGPYKGGPYGLVEEIPAVAGPFNLGMVVVRQSLRIDPHTAQVTAVSDPLPTILDGIPLRVRRVDVTLDRPGFTFNPTNCTPMAITGTLTSTQGASANVSSRFQVGGCRELAFKPSFKVSTQATTSKKNGASLDVKVTSGPGQANIGKVAVSLPKQLPSRLTTIQQACTEATFNQNPASCPAGSNIGTATAVTPVLANPLVGPAYLVSHGGAAFPDLVIILQGEGVTLDLVGSINIRKSITSSAFNSVPDAPISTFELSLPKGPHSALAAVLPAKARGSICGTSLTMPTTITGQNGAQIKQSTRIAVTGCPKAKKKPKHKTGKSRKKRK